jgi:hypothetical protein
VEGVKVPRSQTLFRHTPWIVFAREAGTTYLSPSGKNEMQAVEYMDAFLVIKRKGDWLRLIRYDPAILKNGRLKEWKQAKYCGWINQNDLLLTRSGFTDVVTGFKNKQVVMLTDTLAFADPDTYFANDSVKLFKNPDLTQEVGKIPFYGIVYPYQTAADKGCVLVANKPQLDADSIGQTAIGWMDGRLLTAPEQQLHIDIASLPDSTLVFKDRERKDTLYLSSDEMRQKLQFADNQPTIRTFVELFHPDLKAGPVAEPPVCGFQLPGIACLGGKEVKQFHVVGSQLADRVLPVVRFVEGKHGAELERKALVICQLRL